jgi:hypothetical protein
VYWRKLGPHAALPPQPPASPDEDAPRSPLTMTGRRSRLPPDHGIFRNRAAEHDEVVETAVESPLVVQMLFDEHDLRTGPQPTRPRPATR